MAVQKLVLRYESDRQCQTVLRHQQADFRPGLLFHFFRERGFYHLEHRRENGHRLRKVERKILRKTGGKYEI